MSSSGDRFLYFLIGAGVGSAVALLLAPQTGRETREELSRRASEGREFLNRKVDEGRQYMEDGSRRVSKEVTSIVDRGKGELDELVVKGRETVQKKKEKFTAAFEAGKEAYLHDADAGD